MTTDVARVNLPATGRCLLRPLAVALVASALAAGCGPSNDANRDSVLVFGDSLAHGATDQLTNGLAGKGWRPVVDGRPGWSIGLWAKALPDVVAMVRPKIAVVMLGTNDCAPRCRAVSAGIDRIMATLDRSDVERVFWLNVQQDPSYPDNPGRVDLELQSAAEQWSRLSIVDLDRSLGDDPRLHLPDGVHFNDAGNLRLTALVLDAVGHAP